MNENELTINTFDELMIIIIIDWVSGDSKLWNESKPNTSYGMRNSIGCIAHNLRSNFEATRNVKRWGVRILLVAEYNSFLGFCRHETLALELIFREDTH